MYLECLSTIIEDNLAIHIDLTNNKSWLNYNTGLTTISLTKWINAVSDNINLIDFGLTEFDNGRTDVMWSGVTLAPDNVYVSMYPVGYNQIKNPTTGETSGMTIVNYKYQIVPSITGASTDYYFNLHGGYLQGFFKLQDYNYTLFPARYNKGITIETVLFLYSNSSGIFYMMGARAEDKYNPYFSGETITGTTTIAGVITDVISGVTTTQDNYLDAIISEQVNKKSFQLPEEIKETIYYEVSPINNLKKNVIAFEITQDKRLGYKYINNNGQIITNYSKNTIGTTGFTIIDIVFAPNDIITPQLSCNKTDNVLDCTECRIGKLTFYVNGRPIWIIKDFPEFYFHGFSNTKEKQIGVPYSISWGGGSFGLKNSWHYDYQTYILYNNQNAAYVNSNFIITEDPTKGALPIKGISLSADTNTFQIVDVDNPNIQHNITVMRAVYTGGTGNTYYIKFNRPISTLSNRDYNVHVSIYDDEFFKSVDNSGNSITNKIAIMPFGNTTDIGIVTETTYQYPIGNDIDPIMLGLYPFPDLQEYEYIYLNKIMYYGATGYPVRDIYGNLNTYGYAIPDITINDTSVQNFVLTGQKNWKDLKCTFRTEENSGQNFISIGLLIETSDELNFNKPLYIKDFTYMASDILVQDISKDNLLIEQNFDVPFAGGIQKLRIYDNALSAAEVLHNAIIESKTKPNILVSKGGRIIYR